MQAKTFTLTSFSIKSSSFFRIAITTLLSVGFMLLSQQVSAQIMIVIDDLEYFAPPTTGQNTSSTYATASLINPTYVLTTSKKKNRSALTKIKNPSLTLGPNPINNQATIRKETGVAISKLEILDMSGNMVFTGNFGLGSLYVPNIDPGYYNFRIYTNTGVTNKVIGVN